MAAVNPYIQNLLETNCLREPVYRSAIQALQLPRGSWGLDIGCGIIPSSGRSTNACASRGRRILSWISRVIILSSRIQCSEDPQGQ